MKNLLEQIIRALDSDVEITFRKPPVGRILEVVAKVFDGKELSKKGTK